MVWQANNLKGYVTEMEATAMLKLAKDWNVQKELVELYQKNKIEVDSNPLLQQLIANRRNQINGKTLSAA